MKYPKASSNSNSAPPRKSGTLGISSSTTEPTLTYQQPANKPWRSEEVAQPVHRHIYGQAHSIHQSESNCQQQLNSVPSEIHQLSTTQHSSHSSFKQITSPRNQHSSPTSTSSASQTAGRVTEVKQTLQSFHSDYSLLHQDYVGPPRYPDLLSFKPIKGVGGDLTGIQSPSILPTAQPQTVRHTPAQNRINRNSVRKSAQYPVIGNRGGSSSSQGDCQKVFKASPNPVTLVKGQHGVTRTINQPAHKQTPAHPIKAQRSVQNSHHLINTVHPSVQRPNTLPSVEQVPKRKKPEDHEASDPIITNASNPKLPANLAKTMNSMPPPPPPLMYQNIGAMGGSSGASAPAADKADITDALTMAGIDLREEEALAAQLAVAGHTGPTSAEEAQIRGIAEFRAVHANDPFLSFKSSDERIRQIAMKNGLAVNAGVQGQPASNEMLTYMSLSTREFLLPLLTRAWSIAKYRREGHSTITGEWAPYVKGGIKTTVGPDGTTQGSQHSSLKRSYTEMSSEDDGSHANKTTVKTSVPNEIAKALRDIAQEEYRQEQEWRKKQAARKAAKAQAAAGNNPDGDNAAAAAVAAAATATGSPAPESKADAAAKRISAKESKRNNAIQEAMAHQNANATASMMMGKTTKKKYAWMTAGTKPTPQPGNAGPATPGLLNRTNSGDVDSGVQTFGRRIGEWSDRGDKGLNIQMRDWVSALEDDGRQHKAYVRACLNLN